MSSGNQGSKSKKELLEEYEKDYLTRLKEPDETMLEETKSEKLQDLIHEMTKEVKEIKKHEAKDYVGYCSFCRMGVERKEMAYERGLLFHSNCFEQQGKNFPPGNQELQTQTTNTRVQLAILKNLKVRTSGSSTTSPKTRPNPKKKSRPKRKTKKKRRTSRKKPRRAAKRKPRRRPAKKRKKAPKRRKVKRKTRRRSSRRTKRRTKRSSSRKRRR